jgi:hypothetical protein
MIPNATLAMEVHPTVVPQPIGFHVMVEGRSVAVITRDEFMRAAAEFEAAYETYKAFIGEPRE